MDARPSQFSLFFYIFICVRRLLHITWLRINKFLVQRDLLFERKSKTYHKVLIIGDGFAEGVGDWVVTGSHSGISRHLGKFFHEADNVRHKWAIINRGRAGTTSDDWAPPCQGNGEDDGGAENQKKRWLFEKISKASATNDASIVVLIVGTMDVIAQKVGMPLSALRKTTFPIVYDEEDFCNTVKNVRKIAEQLRKEGKKVIVCDIMPQGAGLDKHRGTIVKVNRQIKQYVSSTKKGKNPLKLLRLSEGSVLRPINRGFDGLHLNSKGYKDLSKDLFHTIHTDVVSVEFNVWRGVFTQSTEEESALKKDN